MSIDGHRVGERMARAIMSRAFSQLACDFAAIDPESLLASLGRIELTIADALTDFRQKTGEGTDVYDDAFAGMVETISTFVENAREAVKRGRAEPE